MTANPIKEVCSSWSLFCFGSDVGSGPLLGSSLLPVRSRTSLFTSIPRSHWTRKGSPSAAAVAAAVDSLHAWEALPSWVALKEPAVGCQRHQNLVNLLSHKRPSLQLPCFLQTFPVALE